MDSEVLTAVTVPVLSGLPPVAVALERSAGGGRAAEHARGRWLLCRLARKVLGAGDIAIAVTDRGAPRLLNHRAGVSISHSNRFTAAAVWPAGPVGVDVEEPPNVLDDRLVRRCCGVWADQVNGLPEPARSAAFARVWTVQEACVKALGLGLAGMPWRIPVDPDVGRGRWRDVVWIAQPCVAATAWAIAVDLSNVDLSGSAVEK